MFRGFLVCIAVAKYIQPHLPDGWKVSNPDVFVDGISTEFDLIIAKAGAQPEIGGFKASEVQAILEVKTSGIIANREKYPLEIRKIRDKFDKVKVKNPRIWGALLMCYGTVSPKNSASINYEKIRKEGLEQHNYGVYTLADSRRNEIEWGRWQEFVSTLLSKFD